MKKTIVLALMLAACFTAFAQSSLRDAGDYWLAPTSDYLDYEFVTNAVPDGSWANYVIQIPISPLTQGQIDSKADGAATTAALATKFSIPAGTTSQYVRGDGSLAATPVGTPGVNGTNPVIVIHSVSTVAYPGSATVTDTVTGNTNSLDIQLPQGAPGTMGATGAAGTAGSNASLPQMIRVQTDASGNYTWTFPTMYGVSVIPAIVVSAEGASTTQINAQVVSTTRSNVVLKVYSIPTQTLLGISVGVPTATQAFIDILAPAP